MHERRQNINTALFVGFFLLAGIANRFSRTANPAWDSLMTCVNYVVFTGLLVFWIESVRVRLLPSRARTYVLAAALLMLLYMLLRIFKYRFAVTNVMLRYLIYAYWIPQMTIPAFFLMACIRIRRGEDPGRWNEKLLLIPATVLSLTAMTNDLHRLVYRPYIGIPEFIVDSGTYSHGPGLYLFYFWMILTLVAGLIQLFREAGHVRTGAVFLLLVWILLWFGLVMVEYEVIDNHIRTRMFNVPEIHIFGMMGVFEICIRLRLIPYNGNYTGFFQNLRIPSIITDRAYSTRFRTEAVLSADTEALRAALDGPVALTAEQKLHGREIRAGFAFWAEDEGAIQREQARLEEANEMLEQENDLIRAETEQKERDAYLRSRHRIYHEIAEKLYPCQKRIGQILEEAVPGREDFREKITRVSVLNAYVKRKTNLLLLASEKDRLSLAELFLALQESAGYLTLAGLHTTAMEPEDALLPGDTVIALYDAFENIAEQLAGRVSALMVSWNGDGLRLAAETEDLPETAGISLPVRFRRDEEILFMDIPAGKDGEPA